MNCLVISHKVCWRERVTETYVAEGGFPIQMDALSNLFDRLDMAILERRTAVPIGTRSLSGGNRIVRPLPEPPGLGVARKLALFFWLPLHLRRIWTEIRGADAVHSLVPGDLGLIGTVIALMQRKPLFVRHCGTWGEPVTLSDRFLLWLLERIAGDRNVVMATGGSEKPPSEKNPAIRWIPSTTLSKVELDSMVVSMPWREGERLRLVTVGRLSSGKNAAAAIGALQKLRSKGLDALLDIVGGGDQAATLADLAANLGIREFVTFQGNVPHEEVMRILAGSHLFVFPTRVKEGFPKAVLEAMACGLPVVATGVSVIPYLLKDGAGIVLNNTDAATVAEAILSLTAEPSRMAAMGLKARRTAQGYSLEAWRDEIGKRLRVAWGRSLKEETGGHGRLGMPVG